ncbi:maleylpyruvate isomerase family mycothiol-dependent enzyme [Jatrophihabitans sp.]|uniref:maleylpyruvate isomerase family mycothiol-dependent enzyme n=1 Tax=Jatrophihabitans sp. TaxID=1932789 RepID=UPI0030C6AE3A|nr:hypothetical protein [Jatrophihabitans sp.]
MTSSQDLFAEIADERRQFADLLAGLSPEQLATPSLCGSWTVQEVGGHLIMPMVTPAPKVLATIVVKRSFDRANESLSRRVGRRPAAEIAATLRQRATSRFTPPGHGPTAPLTDLLIHGQDVRRPLGISREFSELRLRAALDFLASPKARIGFVSPKKIAGLRFVATDLDWTAGDGATVEGPGEALLMAYTGRRAGLADLRGEGVATLRERL